MRTTPFATALVATPAALALVLAPAAAAETSTAAVPQAGYVAAQLDAGGDRLIADYDGQQYDDLGLTLDAVMSLTAAKSADDQATASMAYVIDNAGSYYGYGEDVYANATAKLLTAVTVRGLDPTDVGGVDLVTTLQGLEAESGQFQDRSQWGDYSNTLGQSFALIGLKRAGVNPSTAAVDFLLAQQCTDGGFSLQYEDGCVSDPDATALAVQGLTAVGGQDAAVARAADYLASKQGADGGVSGGTTTEGANGNSTGLASVAFRLAGRTANHDQAVAYLQDLTLGCEYTHLAGGIAYSPTAKRDLEAAGTDAPVDDQTTRTTAQALIGLTGFSYIDASPAGATTETIIDVCEEPTSPTPTPTTPSETPTSEPRPSDEEPVRPEVVQTDSRQGSLSPLLVGLGALGLLLGGLFATPTAARVRRGGTHR